MVSYDKIQMRKININNHVRVRVNNLNECDHNRRVIKKIKRRYLINVVAFVL
jgi:hypothetical protein